MLGNRRAQRRNQHHRVPHRRRARTPAQTTRPGQTKRYSGTITLRDESQKAALTWHFFEAWPSKWAGPAMNAKNNDVAIEEMELAVEEVELEA
jgi:phage tail-like protein